MTRPLLDAWHPQLWVRVILKVDDFRPQPYSPVPAPIEGDPIDIADPLLAAFIILPNSASVTKNSYRRADECSVTLPFAKLPFAPQIVKHASIQVFAGNLDEYKVAAVQGRSPPAAIELVPEVDSERSNEIFRGYVDDWSIQAGEDGAMVTLEARDLTAIPIDAELPEDALAGIPEDMPVNRVIREVLVGDSAAQAPTQLPDIPAQRQTRLAARKAVVVLEKRLEAAQRKQAKAVAVGDDLANIEYGIQVVDLEQRLSQAKALAAVGDSVPILAARYGLPEMRGLQVVSGAFEGGVFVEYDLPAVGLVKGAEWFDSAGHVKKKSKGARSGPKKMSYWDMITDLCVGSGYICYFGPDPRFVPVIGSPPPSTVLIITEAQTYYRDMPNFADEIHTFVYGNNVKDMSVKRKLAGKTAAPVLVQAIEDGTGRTIYGVYPPGADKVTNRTKQATLPGQPGVGDRTEIQTFNLADRIPFEGGAETMTRIARSIYDQVAMGDLEVSTTTRRMSTKPKNVGKNAVDMFDLAAGMPFRFQLAPRDARSLGGDVPTATTVGFWTDLSQAGKIAYLTGALGLPEVTAAVIATAIEDELVPDVLYTDKVQINYDKDTGFSFDVDGVNYVDSALELRKQDRARAATVALLESSKHIQGILATQNLLRDQGVGT